MENKRKEGSLKIKFIKLLFQTYGKILKKLIYDNTLFDGESDELRFAGERLEVVL